MLQPTAIKKSHDSMVAYHLRPPFLQSLSAFWRTLLSIAFVLWIGTPAATQAEFLTSAIPTTLIDGAPWPETLDYPITKIGLSVYVPGVGNALAVDAREEIERACVQYLRETLGQIAPDVQVLSMSELHKEEVTHGDPSIVRAYYKVWLRKWPDARTGDDVILGAADLSIRARHSHSDAPTFTPALFQSAPDRHSLLNAIQGAIKDHMAVTIVAPIEASLSR